MTLLSSFAFWLPWRTTKLFIGAFKKINKKETSKQICELCNCNFSCAASHSRQRTQMQNVPKHHHLSLIAPPHHFLSIKKKMVREAEVKSLKAACSPCKRCYVLISHRSNLSYQCFAFKVLKSCGSPPALARLPSPASFQFDWSKGRRSRCLLTSIWVTVTWGTSQSPLVVVDGGQTFPLPSWDNRAKVRGRRESLGNVVRGTLLWENQPTLARIWGKQFCRKIVVQRVIITFFEVVFFF